MKTGAFFLLLITLGTASSATLQDADAGIVVVQFSWEKQLISLPASTASLASQDQLIQQSKREQQLAAARNSSNKGAASSLETQINNQREAEAESRQTDASRTGYRYKMTLRNEGGKIVKSIDWDYLFIDPITEQVVARHQFTSDETIKPGKQKEIRVLYLIPPVKTVSAAMLAKKEPMPFTELVVLARIQYSDGSSWLHP